MNRPYMNGGIVLKFNAAQRYCTDGVSAAMFRDICRQADVPVQTFVNRSDIAGGSTLGNISNTKVALKHGRYRTGPACHAFSLRDGGRKRYGIPCKSSRGSFRVNVL